METIDREQVQRIRESNPDVTIVEVLPEMNYRKFHLPGAINIPFGEEGFDETIQQAVPDKSKPVIVYCMDEQCQASPKAAKRMDELGYQAVYDYAAGKTDWRNAGLPIES